MQSQVKYNESDNNRTVTVMREELTESDNTIQGYRDNVYWEQNSNPSKSN